jgi:peptidoglycan hydrolase CwlO-like protein
MLNKWIATLILASASLSACEPSEAQQIIQSYHLDSEDGRITFLEEKLTPFIIEIEQLNNEIQELSKKLSETDESNQDEIVDLYNQLNAKMEVMSKNLPIIENVIELESDFGQVEEILKKTSPLTSSEEEVLKRLATIYEALSHR